MGYMEELLATNEEIEAAAQSARVLEFTEQMPQGLDTVVGDRGALLSGGPCRACA